MRHAGKLFPLHWPPEHPYRDAELAETIIRIKMYHGNRIGGF